MAWAGSSWLERGERVIPECRPVASPRMASLIHCLHDAARSVTPGERVFGQALVREFDDEHLVWFDVALGARRRFVDFVVLHPRLGLRLLAVRDWSAAELRDFGPRHGEAVFGGRATRVENPWPVLEARLGEVVAELAVDPELASDGGRLGFATGAGLVLPRLTRAEWRRLDRGQAIPPERVLCGDEIGGSELAAWLERLGGGERDEESRFQLDRVRWHLFPECRLEDEGERREGEAVPDFVRVFDLRQERVLRNLVSGCERIRGVDGAGKSELLVARARALAGCRGRPPLVLCRGRCLAGRLRRMLHWRGVEPRVEVHAFDDWCAVMLARHRLPVPAESEGPPARVAALERAFEDGSIRGGRYGALLVDEVEAFEEEWLRLAWRAVDPRRGALVVVEESGGAGEAATEMLSRG